MFYVCIGHKTNCKSLYFLYLASYPILFLDKFQDAIDDINKTNFCYVGKGKSEEDIIRQRKNLLPLPFHLIIHSRKICLKILKSLVNNMDYSYAITKADYKRIDCLNNLSDKNTFDVEVIKLISKCKNNRTIKSWQRLAEIRRQEIDG